MAKVSLAGFRDPRRRARYIIWLTVVLILFIAIMIPTLAITSSYWFCANACHKVQDDTITAYDQSSHSKINCMACHIPANAPPWVFMLHKMEALGELYQTITDTYPEPLNANDAVALTMPATQCTQCHSNNRRVTPSPGIIIDHKVHADKAIPCPICHNRIAHPDDNFVHKSVNKKTGERGHPHDNFALMQGCFRCHSQEAGGVAPGDCKICHQPSFNLLPASHEDSATWMALGPKGHAHAATEALTVVADTKAEIAKAKAAGEKEPTPPNPLVAKMPAYGEVFHCSICHQRQFCVNCHGIADIPHSAEFRKPLSPTDPKGHPVAYKENPQACKHCHGANARSTFCQDCHHGTYINYKGYNGNLPWTNPTQHPTAVKQLGAATCFQCHEETYCSACHVRIGRK